MALLLTASAGAFGIAALSTGPAAAAPASGGCGANPCMPDIQVDNMAADGSVHVVYTDPYGVLESVNPNSVSLTVAWSPSGSVPGTAPQPIQTSVTLTNGTCSGTGPITCDYAFPSALRFPTSNGFALNGTYKVSASAQDCRPLNLPPCSRTTTAPKSTTLANPPSVPGGVKADLSTDKTSVAVSWTPSPEPDVFAYRVLRNDGSEACNNSTTPTVFSCTDSTSGGGSFAYRVVAYRYGANYDPKSQVASTPSPATKSVTVVGPPATTSTTIPGGTLPPLTQPGFTAKPGGAKAAGGSSTGTFKATPGTAPQAAVGPEAGGDTGFAPTLPYGQQPSTTVAAEDPGSIAAPVVPKKGKTSVGTIAVVGAGFLIAVIALHGLWLRSEVRRSGTLEVLEPEA
jgi:hypothetical protein